MKLENVGPALAGLVNLGCICGLAYIGLKRNNDCYKAEKRAIDAEFENAILGIQLATKDLVIECREREIEELKAKYEVKEEEA